MFKYKSKQDLKTYSLVILVALSKEYYLTEPWNNIHIYKNKPFKLRILLQITYVSKNKLLQNLTYQQILLKAMYSNFLPAKKIIGYYILIITKLRIIWYTMINNYLSDNLKKTNIPPIDNKIWK